MKEVEKADSKKLGKQDKKYGFENPFKPDILAVKSLPYLKPN